MTVIDRIQRVRIYLGRADQWQGSPHYLAILEELRRIGATGATALAGLAGFGPGQRTGASLNRPLEAREPVVIEWIDRTERVERLLPLIDRLLTETLVTIEDIPIYRATLHARGPFANDHSSGDLMRSPAPTVSASELAVVALERLASEGLGVLPVVDRQGGLAGLVTPQDLAWRVGLRLPPHLLAQLAPAERSLALQALTGRTVMDVMRSEPPSILLSTSIPQALVTMVEWGYPQLPVLDPQGQVCGLLGQEQVLRAAVHEATSNRESGELRDAQPPPPVRLVMQTATYEVLASQRLSIALSLWLAAPERDLLVVDASRRLVGMFDPQAALRGLDPTERAQLLSELQHEIPSAASNLPGNDRGLEQVISRDPPTLAPMDSLLEAASRLLELNLSQLAVVDAERRLLGVIARSGLIRALMQQSE